MERGKDHQMSALEQEDCGGTQQVHSVIQYMLKIHFQYKQETGYTERNVLVVKSLFFLFFL